MLPVLALVVLVVVGVLALYRVRPSTVEGTYNTYERFRRGLGVVIIGGVAWTFLRSGRPELIAIALVAVALGVTYIIVEEPHKTLV